ncbi:WRKY domain-containing protein [Dioscorea alata]|uniref:WRKY domain-containing protein n=1 Tax=Dioscorea alata TaxID=55571 RepID=A0ACB7U1J5_DIOAL|nr:WRKY domain-containing protein [Dioscorea alata]
MRSLEKENSVMEELIKGEEKVNMLVSYLADEKAKELLREVRSSIMKAISVFNDSGEVSEVCQESDRRSESSGRKRKGVTMKEGKGGSRRRMSSFPSRKAVVKTAEDGFSWRKYGQKEIFGSSSPRSYFRCTHKHDRNCQATRQVQKSEEDPSMFVITYMGEHTCKDPINASQFLASGPHHASSRLISFASGNNGENIELPFGTFSSLKQENDEEVLSNMTSGSPPPPEFTTFEQMLPEMTPEETSGFDCSNSDCLDMGMMIQDFLDIDDIFNQEAIFPN